MKWLENNPKWTILLIGVATFVVHLDVIPVTIMEARNFITAREMITDGHWLLTTMNNLPRYEKPPLPSWITAIFALIFGLDSVAGMRLPAMLMAICLGFITYYFSLKLVENKRHALINALILLSSFYVIAITIEAPWDIYTHGFMMIAIYYLYAFFSKPEHSWKNGLLAGFFIGLSFMSKGPIAFYALLLPFLFAYGLVFTFKGFSSQKKFLPLLGLLLLAVLIGFWWFLYVRMADPSAFLRITEKETANWSSYNVKPFYYYWSFVVQSGIYTIPAFMSLLYPYLKNKVSHPKIYRFTLLWTVFSVILLSIIPEKKARYLMPVLIPLAMNTGFYLEYIIRAFKNRMTAKERFPVYAHFLLLALIGIAFPFLAYFVIKNGLEGFWGYFSIAAISLSAIGISLIFQLNKKHLFSAILLSVGLFAVIKLTVVPLFGAMEKNKAYRNISELPDDPIAKDLPIYAFGEIAPEMIWEYGASIPVLKGDQEITIPEGDRFGVLVVLAEEDEFKRIFDLEHAFTLQTVYDLNPNANPQEKGHKNRLVSNLYIVTTR